MYIQEKFWVWKYWEIRNKYIQEVFHSPKNCSENICHIKVGSNENEEEWKKTRPAAADKARWKQRTWMIWTDVITGCGWLRNRDDDDVDDDGDDGDGNDGDDDDDDDDNYANEGNTCMIFGQMGSRDVETQSQAITIQPKSIQLNH